MQQGKARDQRLETLRTAGCGVWTTPGSFLPQGEKPISFFRLSGISTDQRASAQRGEKKALMSILRHANGELDGKENSRLKKKFWVVL